MALPLVATPTSRTLGGLFDQPLPLAAAESGISMKNHRFASASVRQSRLTAARERRVQRFDARQQPPDLLGGKLVKRHRVRRRYQRVGTSRARGANTRLPAA
jgi:hypothetical protein